MTLKVSKMFLLFSFTITLIFVHFGCCSQCPPMFQRFCQNHSFCKPRNPQCRIMSSGLRSDREKEEILSEHNKYRSKCALGNERGAGGLPMASDMMEMVWDDELAAIAQKWAEQCIYKHDCSPCRAVNSYNVGQNIGKRHTSCSKRECLMADKLLPRNWTAVVESFIVEIKFFDKNLVKSVQFDESDKERTFGHLTQVIWGKTWRVGCGYASYVQRNEYIQLYVCNYGPSGNVKLEPVYTEGKPCSQCPANTCCGESCKQGNSYPGLCRMLDEKDIPIYRNSESTTIFQADFGKSSQSDLSLTGVNKWKTRPTFSGNILQIELNGGESSTLYFNKAIEPSQSFCMRMEYRKGPNVAGQLDSNKLEMHFEPEGMLPVKSDINPSSPDVMTADMNLSWKEATKFWLTFSVPPDAPPQYLDVLSIITTNGMCKTYG